ncbi:MAG: alpha/beta hydrolase [Leptospira sp.]|nr:alpha/beta hydrolase [Leptospira sp.]
MNFLYKYLFYKFERSRIKYFKSECDISEKYFDMDGFSIYYLEKPGVASYPTIVLIHGFLDACYGFRKLVQHLNYPGRILIPDMPGFGRSKLPKFPYLYQLDIFADMLFDWIQKMQLKSMIICGHSMGGLVSQKIILKDQNSDKSVIEKAILLATGGIPHPQRDEMRDILFPKSLIDISKLLGYLYHSDFPEPSMLVKKTLLNKWNGWENRYLGENTVRREKEIFFGEKAREIKIPTLIAIGEQDELTTVDMMKQYKKWIKSSKLEIISDTRHALHNERAEAVARMIQNFLKY